MVYYIRDIINLHGNYPLSSYHVLVNLGFIEFVRTTGQVLTGHILSVEIARETATIIMLAAVAWLAGKNSRQRFGGFLISFACWDIFYYVFLKILSGWPSSFTTKDVYFLIPFAWVGPVITPLVISALMFVAGAKLYLPTTKA